MHVDEHRDRPPVLPVERLLRVWSGGRSIRDSLRLSDVQTARCTYTNVLDERQRQRKQRMVAAGRLAARASYHCSLLYQQTDLRALAELSDLFGDRLHVPYTWSWACLSTAAEHGDPVPDSIPSRRAFNQGAFYRPGGSGHFNRRQRCRHDILSAFGRSQLEANAISRADQSRAPIFRRNGRRGPCRNQ